MEQDRKDAIPSVLNDLIDVDGTPAVGDGLVFDGANWVPSPPYGSVNGPLLRVWNSVAATLPAEAGPGDWNGTEPVSANADQDWLGAPDGTPDWGHWVDGSAGWEYHITEPGIYTAEAYAVVTFDAPVDHLATISHRATPGIHTYNLMENAAKRRQSGVAAITSVIYMPQIVAHPDTDATYWWGYEPPIKNVIAPGVFLSWETPGAATVATTILWEFSLFQWSPGATTSRWR